MLIQNSVNLEQKTFTANGTSSSLPITLPSYVTRVKVEFYNLKSSAANALIGVQFSSDGITYITSGYQSTGVSYGTSVQSFSYTSNIIISSGVSIPANQLFNGSFSLFYMNTPGDTPFLSGDSLFESAVQTSTHFSGSLLTTINATAFRIIDSRSSGNITGTFVISTLS